MSTKDTNLSSIWILVNGKIFTNCMVFLTKIQTWPVTDAATLRTRTVYYYKYDLYPYFGKSLYF